METPEALYKIAADSPDRSEVAGKAVALTADLVSQGSQVPQLIVLRRGLQQSCE
jgi:hypothetical protein